MMQSISGLNDAIRVSGGEETSEGLHFRRQAVEPSTATGPPGQRGAVDPLSRVLLPSAALRVDSAEISRGLKPTQRFSTTVRTVKASRTGDWADRSNRREPLIVIVALIIALAAFVARCVAEETKLSEGVAAASSYQIGGHDHCVRPHAAPSNTPAYCGYYVGGGAAHHGEERFAEEGTWGWDYFGRYFSRHIDLGWWHGARYQGGIGAYKTDGPKLHHD